VPLAATSHARKVSPFVLLKNVSPGWNFAAPVCPKYAVSLTQENVSHGVGSAGKFPVVPVVPLVPVLPVVPVVSAAVVGLAVVAAD